MADLKRYWFPAKRYGWGWGAPLTWQGWLVLAIYVAVMVVGAIVVDPAASPMGFFVLTTVASAILVVVCYCTGEPPRWRWGGDGKDR